MTAHPSALIDPAAEIADDVEIGPFCVIGPGVRLGPGCRIGPRVSLYGPVVAGRGNLVQAGVTIGKPDGGRIEIGDANVFREFSHVDAAKGATTRIGSRNRIGTWAGVNSGGSIGDGTRLGAYSVVGDNCIVEDGAWIQPQVVIDPNRRVGRGALVRIQMTAFDDVPPYMCLDGSPPAIQSVNPTHRTSRLDLAFEIVYKSGLSLPEAAQKLIETADSAPEIAALAEFLRSSKAPEAAFE